MESGVTSLVWHLWSGAGRRPAKIFLVGSRSYYRKEQWLVKWKGYGEDRNTWEPWDNLLTEQAQAEAQRVKAAALAK